MNQLYNSTYNHIRALRLYVGRALRGIISFGLDEGVLMKRLKVFLLFKRGGEFFGLWVVEMNLKQSKVDLFESR